MKRTDNAKAYRKRLLGDRVSSLAETDPEYIERFENFAFDEVIHQGDLDERTRMMAILAALLGCQGIDAFEEMVEGALNLGVTPVEIKEIVYQGTAYLGFGKVLPFLHKVNDVLKKRGIALPLEGQATTTMEDRLEKGEQTQVDIFGESMRGFATSGPQESRHINRWLSDNCFGDYYTRSGLDHRHAAGNMMVGNDKAFLIQVLSQCLPYIGYPRSLNALRCINEAAGQLEGQKAAQ